MATKSKRPSQSKKPAKRWSQDVTEHSDALDLDKGVFTREEYLAKLKR